MLARGREEEGAVAVTGSGGTNVEGEICVRRFVGARDESGSVPVGLLFLLNLEDKKFLVKVCRQ